MTEFLLNSKIFHASQQTVLAQTGDNSNFLILFFIAIVSGVVFGIIFFKKKFVKVILSLILAFSFVTFAPKKSFADQTVIITSSAEVSEDAPAELTITNNDNYAVSINSLEISNQVLPQNITWTIIFVKDKYEIKNAGKLENVCFDIAPHSSYTFSIYPNVDEIPVGELCIINFKAISTHYNATYANNEDNVSVNNDFDFSFSTFENADNTIVNREVAKIQATFACIPNTYNNIIFDNINYSVNDRLAFMRNLGFEDNFYCKLWPDQHNDTQEDTGVSISIPSYDIDKNDVTSFCFNHKKINFGTHYSEIINISVGATGGDFEWASNFDFGAETNDYANATGPHPEWENKADHKGLDIARKRLMDAYQSYYNKYIDNDLGVYKIILINGHSRGGGIANLLGRDFELKSGYKPFTYTFASPNTTTYTAKNEYKTIKNILNLDDLVCQFPGYVSGFCKYGQDFDLSVHDDFSIDSTPLFEIFNSKSGYGTYNGNSPDDVSSLLIATCDLIEDRDNSYTLNSEKSKQYYKLGSYETRDAALADVDEFKANLEKYKLNYYAKYDDVEIGLDGKWRIKFTCCAAFFMQDISNWLFIIKDDYDGPFFGYNTELINILKQALGSVSGVFHGHIWMSYNLLSKYDKLIENSDLQNI